MTLNGVMTVIVLFYRTALWDNYVILVEERLFTVYEKCSPKNLGISSDLRRYS